MYPGTPANEMEKMLTANCIKTEERDLEKHFTPEEMNSMREGYWKNTFLIRAEIAKLNAAKLAYAEATKDAVKENGYLVTNLQNKCQLVAAQVYLFPDFESRMIGSYDNTGALIDSRRMTPTEAQIYIPQSVQ